MFYTRLQVVCDPDWAEIIMAEVAEAGFEAFLETEKGFEAYVENEKFNPNRLAELQEKYQHVNPLLFFQDRVKKQNWNKEWERSIEPIIVDDTCVIRAEFHKITKKYPYEIVITPKMSFGTGHHQTTYLMIRNQMKIKHAGRRVLDVGCGTAILSIMACKLDAREVVALDIDEWSVTNGHENIERNGCKAVTLHQGTIDEVDPKGTFDIVLANINKNVLLKEMKTYVTKMAPEALLLISGFYNKDIPDLLNVTGPLGLNEVGRDERDEWASVLLKLK